MKQLLKLSFLFFLIGCGKTSEKNVLEDVKAASEAYLKKQLKDPTSYQNISIDIIDSVKQSESLEENFELLYDDTMIEIGGATKSERDSALAVINNLKSNPKSDSLAYVSLSIKYRAKNSFGAIDKGESVIYYFIKPQRDGECCMIFSNSNKNQ